VRGYRYVQTRDETDALPRPAREIAAHYARVISQIGLRTIHEVLEADPAGVVDSVAFNGRLSTVNRATGRPDRPYLLSVFVDRETFSSLVLAHVDVVACVKALGAHMSPHPFEIEDVRPIVDTEAFLAQFNFIDGADVIAGLDSRLDLLDLSPWDFETFVKELFTGKQLPDARRLKVWQTQEVSDDGVDAVAVNDDPVFGGNVVIQAKKYSKAVPPAAIRELMGSMADKHATKGILVTTSWVGPKGIAQAKRDGRIDIIDCHGLMSMCREQGLDVLIGLPNPPPVTGRPRNQER
jgi:restriction system protein